MAKAPFPPKSAAKPAAKGAPKFAAKGAGPALPGKNPVQGFKAGGAVRKAGRGC